MEQADLGFTCKPQTKFQRQLTVQGKDIVFEQLLTLHSAPWGEQRRDEWPSQQCRKPRQKQVRRERLEGRWEHLGAETALDIGQALVFTAPSAGPGSLSADVPRCDSSLEQISCELPPSLPGTCSCQGMCLFTHSFKHVLSICLFQMLCGMPRI